MALKLNSSSGGSVTLQEPTTASNYTLTVPAQTSTILTKDSTSGMSVPTFRARPTSGGQSFSSNVFTKLTCGTEDWDTANCFDTSNSRFTPNVAGYYQISGAVGVSAAVTLIVTIYKNGSVANTFFYGNSCVTNSGSCILYLNGTTDYVELYGRSGTTTTVDIGSGDQNWFCAALVRAA